MAASFPCNSLLILIPCCSSTFAAANFKIGCSSCKQLKKNLENDTIFFVRTDKVLILVSIKECKRPDSLGIQEVEKLKIEEFTLDYITDFYRGTNQLYIGQRTRLEKVKPNETGEKWHEASKKELTPVSEAIAKSQLSEWKITRLIIQL